MRKVPVIATLLVLAAVAVMLRLGFWQLDRMHEKEALLARYAAAAASPADAGWDGDAARGAALLYRRARVTCATVAPLGPVAGHDAAGTTGWAQQVSCTTPAGHTLVVVTGWSEAPTAPATRWQGGEVRGTVAQGMAGAPRLIAEPALEGLKPSARPDPASVPNNHLSYAVQWFLFAATALIIYALALRKRARG